ncbi:Transposase [Shigella dysenteriae 1617]|uniref:Transposase n=1 Tax=Shigella dysenteriae 1617 TaxID=754093 RepID=A0A0A7A370_SHIDY|nr:Transposase [Shigella dysenteriae 1617]
MIWPWNGVGVPGELARIMGVSLNTIYVHLKTQAAVGNLAHTAGSDVIVCAEMDEQWGYVGAKSRQRWLFYAYDRLRKTVVAHVFGERTMATLGRLMSLLPPFDVVIMDDGLAGRCMNPPEGKAALNQQAIYAAN